MQILKKQIKFREFLATPSQTENYLIQKIQSSCNFPERFIIFNLQDIFQKLSFRAHQNLQLAESLFLDSLDTLQTFTFLYDESKFSGEPGNKNLYTFKGLFTSSRLA